MRDTLDYVRQRRQFGVPLSSFQVPQHRLADMHMALEQAAALTASVGQGAVQLHGGMGMTEELAVGHYMRRATLIEGLFGPASWHLRRVAELNRAEALA